MKKLLSLVAIGVCCLSVKAYSFNPITDVQDNVVWTFGKKAEIGQAVKIWGNDGLMKDGEWATSALAGIADYRFLAFSYGGTVIDKANVSPTDTFKIGLKLNYFLGWFKSPPTPEMAFLYNLDIGPSLAMPVFTAPHVATLLIDVNYAFGGK